MDGYAWWCWQLLSSIRRSMHNAEQFLYYWCTLCIKHVVLHATASHIWSCMQQHHTLCPSRQLVQVQCMAVSSNACIYVASVRIFIIRAVWANSHAHVSCTTQNTRNYYWQCGCACAPMPCPTLHMLHCISGLTDCGTQLARRLDECPCCTPAAVGTRHAMRMAHAFSGVILYVEVLSYS